MSPATSRRAAILAATLLLASCGKQESVLAPIKRAQLKERSWGTETPPSQWRAELREVYRLRPDARFLLAFGEIDRLAGKLPAPPGKAATAEFADGGWRIHLGNGKTERLTELPDFSDYFPVLVAYAKETLPSGPPSSASSGRFFGGTESIFLMPGLLKEIDAAERSLEEGRSYREAARAFARLAFQVPDRLELSPLIPARSLALVAAARAQDARGVIEEEVLLAHALGYTQHAQTLALRLPSDAPLRAFEALDDRALAHMASTPTASEETRYLAIRRATSQGDLVPWRQARDRYMRGNDSVAVIASGLDIELPRQFEVTERKELLDEALPRAVLRELSRVPSSPHGEFEAVSEFDTKLKIVADSAKGPLWDAAAARAYYEAAYFAPLEGSEYGRLGNLFNSRVSGPRLARLYLGQKALAPNPDRDPTGAPLILRQMHDRYQTAPRAAPQAFLEIRSLVPWLDSRPSHRWELAYYTRYMLQDPRAAEDLYRGLIQVLSDSSRQRKAESAMFVGDWATVHRLLGSPELTAPEAIGILWSWYTSKVELEQLAAEFDRAIERFPNNWDLPNSEVELLRSRKEYRKACQVLERWLARNTDPLAAGYFHAHIRLGHSYVLAGQYEKGRQLLAAMNESDRFRTGNRDRGLAECLAGLNRMEEAEAMARKAVTALPEQSEARLDLVQILWRRGKDAEAANLLVDPRSYLQAWEVCETLRKDFPRVFLDLPPERLIQAVDGIAKNPKLSSHSSCVVHGLGDAGRWEDALRVADRLSLSRPDRMDELIILYDYMKSWKGREAAAAWLKEKIPPGQRNPLSMKALYTKNDDLLWDVIGTPDPSNHPEWVWLFRSVAFALRGSETDPRRGELLSYYAKDSSDPYQIYGRYLMGLSPEAAVFALGKKQPRSEVAYYLGVRAQHENRFRDACEWYRVAAESGEETSPRALALYTLGEWVGTGQGIWKVEADVSQRK